MDERSAANVPESVEPDVLDGSRPERVGGVGNEPRSSGSTAAIPRHYEAVIKVCRTDEPGLRARAIAEGIGYACALLHDEYGWPVDQIESLLERTLDNIYDDEAQRV